MNASTARAARPVRRVLALSITTAFLLESLGTAAVVHVNASAPPGGNGASWATAFDDLAAALAASQPGDQLWVTGGTYTNAGGPFFLPAGVALYGGFGGNETLLSQRNFEFNVTVLDGQNARRVLEISDAALPDTILDGVTIINGSDMSVLTLGTFTLPLGRGAAIYAYAGSPTIRNMIFANNHVNENGGVIYAYAGSPSFESCLFTSNSAGKDGGVGYFYNGSVSMLNCVLQGNTAATGSGGAVYSYDEGSPLFVNCLFTANQATAGDGGAIYRYGSGSNPLPLTLLNCTLTNNHAGSRAGAMYDYYGQSVVANSIVYGNTAPQHPNLFHSSSGTTKVTFSCVQGGFSGIGNISGPPHFASGSDFHVLATSPCIDAGNSNVVPNGVLTDLAGNPRLTDFPTVPDTGIGPFPIVDMGAYEGTGCLYETVVYGAGCAGSGDFVPILSGTNCPQVGQQFSLSFSNALGGAPAIVLAGAAQGLTPVDPFCNVLTAPILSPLFTFPLGGTGAGNGSAVLSFTISPSTPIGIPATVQYFTSDPGAPTGIAGSNGLQVTFNP